MNAPTESQIAAPAGCFRALTWGNPEGETVVLLHGLSGVAEVWGPTVERLDPARRYVAIDQRGHGDSPRPGSYTIGQFVADTKACIEALGTPLHLVGHSMGARVAIVVAARYPKLLQSVAIVDIGVEASVTNIRETSAGLSTMPQRFATEAEAFAFAFSKRVPTDADRAIFRARLRETPSGLEWRGSPEAMIATVRAQRARNYWREWRAITTPTLFIRGGRSGELSATIAAHMRATNPLVRYQEFDGVPHNIPLIAPEPLAHALEDHWRSLR